ncbi:hypothetical protein MSZK_38510 [Mycobacterium sp. shizuoka-1]|nr:hypothetical protein MSZK_38510 [Mycobacterium sp. shizuoka-1]
MRVSRFTETMFGNARWTMKGMVTGEPDDPVRHSWAEVHERAARIAGGLASAGVGHGDAVAVLAGAAVDIAATAQGIWMRGASVTMLHQPTPRTDLGRWAEETTTVITMIEAKAPARLWCWCRETSPRRRRGSCVVTTRSPWSPDPAFSVGHHP